MEEEQIQTASHLVCSRLDLIPAARAAEVQRAVALLAPRAVPVTADALAEELSRLEAATGHREGRAQLPVAPPHQAHHHGGEAHARHHFASLQVKLEGPVDEQAFLTFLSELPPEILRAKGIVELRDPPGERRSFQKVDRHVEISPCRLADPDEEPPVAVFVGPSIPEALVRAQLAALVGG
jgi:G3E family GTPase